MTNFQDVFDLPISAGLFKEANPIMLAFIGDSVHTLFVRDQVVKGGNLLLKDYHKKSAGMCRAKYQAELLNKILPILNEEEKDIVRRARNAKTHTIAKHTDMETYKKATSLEALIGYIYLNGNYTRLKEILKYEKEWSTW